MQNNVRVTGAETSIHWGPKKRFKDHIKVTLKSCDMHPDNLESLAEDKVGWREVCAEGPEVFNVKYNAAAEERRARCHQSPAADEQYVCDECWRRSASQIELIDHHRATDDEWLTHTPPPKKREPIHSTLTRIMSGINSIEVRQKLLAITPFPSIKTIVEIWRIQESAVKDSATLSNKIPIDRIKNKPKS